MTQTKAELLQTRHQGDLKLGDADSSHYVGFKAPATVGSNLVWTLPATDGSANQFLQTNASGVLGWGTADVSSAMPLTGGTFTGTVNFGDNVKARFGTGNDLQIYHDGSNSYIDDADTGNLVIRSNQINFDKYTGEALARFRADGSCELFYDNASKLATTSAGIAITGAATISTNLTVTGDLTVSGTTTTINTQTLEVEDKNITLGKVSSPSNTTANGGGITLLGSTNKTFVWESSTGAWKSSEDINLGDDKKLFLGNGLDLEIYHSSNNWNYITSPTSRNLSINPVTGEAGIQVLASQGVKLFYNNSQKLETTSGGINVTGAINVNGSALSSAPTITATASGAISATDAIIAKSDGNVEKVTETITANSSPPSRTSVIVNQTQLMNWKVVHCTGTDMVVGLYNYESNRDLQYRVGKLSGTGTITWNPSGLQDHADLSNIWSGQQNTEAFDMAWDETEQKLLIVTGQEYSPHNARARLFDVNVSNSTLSASSSSVNIRSGSWYMIDNGISVRYIGNRKFIASWLGEGTERYGNARVIEANASGSSLTLGSVVSWPSASNSDRINNIQIAEPNAAGDIPCTYVRWGSGSDNRLYGRSMTVSGTTITLGSEVGPISTTAGEVSVGAGVNGMVPSISYDEDNDVYFVCYKNSNKFRGRAFKATGTTFATVGNEIQLGSNNPSGFLASTYDPIYNKHICYVTDNYNQLKYFEVTTTTTGSSASSEVNTSEGHRNGGYSFVFIGATTYNADFNRHLYVGTISSGQSYSLFMGPYATSATNMTADNFIGFSSDAYSNGATATINIVGNTTTKSGLTPGKKYYVQKNGEVRTSAASPSVVAGTAVSSTKLIVNPGR